MENKITKVAGLIAAALSAQAFSASMTVTGTLEARTPALTAAPQGTLYEGVKQAVVSLTPNDLVCKILFASTATPPNGSLGCYAALSSLPAGMTVNQSKGELSGFTTARGAQSVPYTITYYSGTAKTPVQVGAGNLAFQVEPVVAPKITTISSKFDEGWVDGSTADVHKVQPIGDLRVTGEARPYDQVVNVDDFGTCTIVEGQTQCSIETVSMRRYEGDNLVGNKTFPVSANSKNTYFADFVSQFVMNWDFRPPVIGGIKEGNHENPLDTIESKSGTQTVPYSHMAAIVTSPHYAITNSGWWKPKYTQLTLSTDPDSKRIPTLVYNGKQLLSVASYSNNVDKMVLDPNTNNRQTGVDEFLFDFNLSNIGDGDFLGTITAADQYGNSATTEKRKITLNRHSPEVGLFNDKLDPVAENSTVFFFGGMVIGAWNGYTDGLSTVKAHVGDLELPLTATDKSGVYVVGKVDTSTLVAGKSYPLVIEATDTQGRTTTKTVNIAYADTDLAFTYTGKPPIQFTQQIKVGIKTAGSYRCPLTYSSDEATAQAKQEDRIVCHVEWSTLPKSMSYNVDMVGNASVSGYIDEDVGQFGYTIYAHKPDGDTLRVRDGTYSITPQLAVEPTIKFGGARMQGDHGLMIDSTGGTPGYAQVISSPGDVTVSLDGEGITSSSTTVRQRAISSSSDLARSTTYIKVPKGDIWKIYPVRVSAKYARSSKYLKQETVNVYLVPTKNLRLNIERLGKEWADTNKAQVKVSVGVSDGKNGYTYDKSQHGEWMVHLVQKKLVHSDKGWETVVTRLTQDVKTDGEGSAILEFDPSATSGGSVTYQAIASVISPIPDFVLQLNSKENSVTMIKGAEPDGSLTEHLIVSRTPLRATVVVRPDSKADEDALGHIKWQIQEGDSGNWTDVPDYANKKSMSFKSTVAGKWHVRAILTNRLTGASKTTETATLVAYAQPAIKIKQDNVVIKGQAVPVHLEYEDGTVPALSDLNVQWSTDGKTWLDGSINATLLPDYSAPKLYARAQYADTSDEADAKSWITTTSPVKVFNLGKISAKVTALDTVEAGKTFTLTATHDKTYDSVPGAKYIEEWTMPDGTTVSGSSVDWSTQEDGANLQFTYSVWLDGYKDSTLNTVVRKVSTWAYHFPKLIGSSRQSYRLAPTDIEVVSSTDLKSFPGVTYDLKFYADDGITVTKTANGRMQGKITKPGSYMVKMVLTDNRGNSSSKEFMFAADEAVPMVIRIEPLYSNRYMRAPMDAILKASVKLDHPSDKVEAYEWTIDGKAVADGISRQMFSDLAAGTHHIELNVVSAFGQRGTSTFDVVVQPNSKPVCKPSAVLVGSSWNVKASCVDSDGYIVGYRWSINGTPISLRSSSILFSKTTYPGQVLVDGVAVDDSGDETPFTVTTQ